MATPTTPAPQAPATHPTMCLLHGDFHVMEQDCWSVTATFFFARASQDQQAVRDAYLSQVERKMLDNHTRSLPCPTH